jgi:hypothetical protein
MKKEFYKLRNLKSLFEFKELENKEIYFASPKELSYPMERFKDLIFNEDKLFGETFLNTIFYV